MAGLTLLCSPLNALGQEEIEPPADDPERSSDRLDWEEPSEVIVITASRTERALGDAVVATQVVTRHQIEASGAQDVGRLLSQQPGLLVVPSLQGDEIRMRGFNPEHVLILVDGQRLTGRTDGAIDLSRIPVESVEQIEIVKGPASALYGSDAMAGVIHIRTRSPEQTSGHLHGRLGTSGVRDTNGGLSFVAGPVSNRLTVGWHDSEAYRLDPDTLSTDGSAFQSLNLANKTRIKLHRDAWFDLQGGYTRRLVSGVDENAGGAILDRSNLTEEIQVGGGPTIFPDARSRLQLTGWFTRYSDQFVYGQRGGSALDKIEASRDTLGQVTMQYQRSLGDNHYIVFGGEAAFEELVTERIDGEAGTRRRGAVFAQDEWTLGRLLLSPGIRLDLDSWFGTWGSPRLAARLAASDDLVLRGSVGMGYRAPAFKELLLQFENPGVGYVIRGNPDLRPERSQSVDLSLDWQPTRELGLTVALFGNHLDDLITFETVADEAAMGIQYSYTNINRALTAGAEAGITLRPLEHLDLRLNYILTHSRDLTLGRQLPGRALHQAHGGIDWFQPRLRTRLSAQATVVGPRPFYLDHTEAEYAPSYARVDSKLTWDGPRFGALFIGVDNLLNAGTPDWLPIRPRFFYAGFDLRLPGRPAPERPDRNGVMP